MLKIIFLGSPEEAIAPLKHLLEEGEKNGIKLVAVVSQPGRMLGRGKKKTLTQPPVAKFAIEKNIPLLQPEKARCENFLSQFGSFQPDIAITCAYGQILTEKFLSIPNIATINIHPSALPKYRGATPVPAALWNGEKTTAVSILYTVKALDAGDIILQKSFEIFKNESGGELLKRLFKESGPLLIKAILAMIKKDFLAQVQDLSQVTHCKKFSKEDGVIDWALPAQTIINRFRALSPWPGSFWFVDSKRIVVEKMEIYHDSAPTPTPTPTAGTLNFLSTPKKLLIATGDQWIELVQLKPEGKKAMPGHDYWNGSASKSTNH